MAEKLTRVNKVVRWIQQQYPHLGRDDKARSGIKQDLREAYDAEEISGRWRKPTKQHWDYPDDGLHMSRVEPWAEETYGTPCAVGTTKRQSQYEALAQEVEALLQRGEVDSVNAAAVQLAPQAMTGRSMEPASAVRGIVRTHKKLFRSRPTRRTRSDSR